MISDYASRSVEQQETALRKLGVIHNQTLNVGGIHGHDKINALQQDLIVTMYKNDFNADKKEPGSAPINLSKSDRERAQLLFLASLQYDSMVDRESRIATAHESTFRWVLQDNQSQDHQPQTTKWSNIGKWLESDDQLYWITGKAGSGKSTLMKFLCSPTAEMLRRTDAQKNSKHAIDRERSRCHPYLEKWAGALRLVVASFYFWNSDEFDGSHEDLISIVTDLIKDNSHVKICVASRPWNIFQTAFSQRANLRLEDLTFDDIRNFVGSKFHADKEFENLEQRHLSFSTKLMDNIVVKASGVFLWVDLVVTSLLAGMRLGDRIEDFQRRLDELPPDLEKLYEKILHSLDPFYLEHAAQYFTLVEAAEGPLTILQLSFADEESPQSAIEMRLRSFNKVEMSLRIEAMNRRLNSRCKGFLETDRGLQGNHGIDRRNPSQITIQYLHRTVRDFIKSPKAQSFLRLSTNRNYDPSIQLCVAYLMDMKAWDGQQDYLTLLAGEEEERPTVTKLIRCLRKAASVAKVNEGAMIELLDELKSLIRLPDYGKALAEVHNNTQMYATPVLRARRPGIFPVESFLPLAVIHGVVPYVRARAGRGGLNPIPFPLIESEETNRGWPLLLDALSLDVPDPAMVECLLDLGADPNFKTSRVVSQTPWHVALTNVTSLYSIQDNHGTVVGYPESSLAEDRWKKTLSLMYSRGADCRKVPEPLLSPISRKILQDLMDEAKTGTQNKSGLMSWLTAGNLG
ncbi:hypothetical protein SLS60_010786 [Paraconiothyrium brasiliense]|uniref:Ankyrin repeat protein n=1 Tax=Paraconiothyrium brasiliense TaxID=300254 RepID=A0ABR3QMH8_9PLEO